MQVSLTLGNLGWLTDPPETMAKLTRLRSFCWIPPFAHGLIVETQVCGQASCYCGQLPFYMLCY